MQNIFVPSPGFTAQESCFGGGRSSVAWNSHAKDCPLDARVNVDNDAQAIMLDLDYIAPVSRDMDELVFST